MKNKIKALYPNQIRYPTLSEIRKIVKGLKIMDKRLHALEEEISQMVPTRRKKPTKFSDFDIIRNSADTLGI